MGRAVPVVFLFASRVTDSIVAASSIAFVWHTVFKSWSNNGNIENASHIVALISFGIMSLLIVYKAVAPLLRSNTMIPLYSADQSLVNSIIAGMYERIKHNLSHSSWPIDIAKSVNTMIMTGHDCVVDIGAQVHQINARLTSVETQVEHISVEMYHGTSALKETIVDIPYRG